MLDCINFDKCLEETKSLYEENLEEYAKI